MSFQDLINQINQIADDLGLEFSNFVERRWDCIQFRRPRQMPLRVTITDDSLAIGGAKNELQFNIALGHERPGEVRAGLALSFSGRSNPRVEPGDLRYRDPPVWLRLDALSGRFPLPVESVVWNPDDSQPSQHQERYLPIGPEPIDGFYFFGRFFGWEEDPDAISDLAQRIAEYFSALMPIYETVYCEDSWKAFIQPTEVNPAMLSQLRATVQNAGQLIFSGPPGTSKTWWAKRLAASLLWPDKGFEAIDALVKGSERDPAGGFAERKAGQTGKTGEQWDLVQFHPAYNYEDFVRGIQVSTDKESRQVRYDTRDRVFAEICSRASAAWDAAPDENKDQAQRFVLIIDEINRANLASVLGELIYGLEYRGEPVRTPYAAEDDGNYDLVVPDNLYIIGTLNTADRSVGHIDYAVRRRFAFVPMLPNREVVSSNPDQTRAAAERLFDAVGRLFRQQEEELGGSLSPDFHADDVQPGHTYFLAETPEMLLHKLVYQLLPLLREYVKDGVLIKGPKLQVSDKLDIDLSTPFEASAQSMEELHAALWPNGAQPGEEPGSRP